MTNANAAPIQLADAPASDFLRGPVYDLTPVASPLLGPAPSPRVQVAAQGEHAAPAVCPAPAGLNGVAPIEVREPPPGQRVDITLTPNQPLSFDFNPLDATALRHGDDLTLTFPDGGVVVLHHVSLHGTPLPTPLELPDGTIINPCDLLQALPGLQANPEAGKIPNEKIPLEEINPAAGPAIIAPVGAHPVVTPFELPGLGAGLTPLGALTPQGFTTTVIPPPPGASGVPPTPPTTPPTPPTPPAPPIIPPEDVATLHWGSSPATGTASGNFFFDLLGSTAGDTATAFYSQAENPTYVSGTPPVDPGTLDGATPLLGYFGELTMTAGGSYSYTLSNTNALGIDVVGSPGQEGLVASLGSDLLSQSLTQAFLHSSGIPLPLQDTFYVQDDVSAGTFGDPTTDATALLFNTFGADVTAVPGNSVTTMAPLTSGGLLVTYTDVVDPAHSFQTFVSASNIGSFTLGSVLGTLPFEPTDPGLVSVENLTGAPVTISSVTVAGETESNSLTLDAGTNHALTFMIDPNLSAAGDPGDVGSSSAATLSNAAAGSFVDSLASGGITYADATIDYGNLYSTTGPVSSVGASADSAYILDSTTGGEFGGAGTNVLVYDTNTQSTGFDYDGGTGLNVLRFDSAGATLDFTAAGTTINNGTVTLANGNAFSNLDVIDLTAAAANSTAGNTLTLNAADVLALTQNEPAAVSQGNTANTMWILGTSADTVNLTGGTWTQISAPVASPGQSTAPTTPTQMVGFTEYSSTVSANQSVHVYVENAIAQAGHVSVH